MKFLKYLFFLILIAIIGFSLYIATLSGDYQVEESKVVQAPLEMLFDDVNNYKTWEKWGPWTKNNTEMIVTYTEKTSGEGAGYSWKSDQMEGSIKTTEVIPGNSIEQEVVFKTPLGEAKSEVYWLFETKENGTEITWGMKGEQQFWEKAYELTQDSTRTEMIRPMLKNGLNNLAAFVKKAMEVYEISVDGTTMHSGGYYMYMTTASRNTGKALETKVQKIIPHVSLYMKQNNIPIAGAPMTVYNNFDEQNATVIISVGIPTSSRIITPEQSEVLCGFLPNQKVVKATLKGNYDHLPEAWAAAKNYILENGYEMNKASNPFEVYLVNPDEVHNPAEWITEVYLPIK
ncbi:MAG TPA: GyrI-like domain-containing protein [Flavobacteriaceae bacterium]|nr:GyrI-like domain-containing protein [Flavobacteriaceae bacterium]